TISRLKEIKITQVWKRMVDVLSAARKLAAQDRGGIGILAKCFGIATGQNLHHPVIEVIHRVRSDRLETAIVLFMSLLNVITQSKAQILILAPDSHILGSQHLDVLH